jgi:hypothetical protein
MSTISAGTTSTTAFKVTSDTTGSLLLKTGASGVTAVDIDASQVVTIGNIAVTGGTINNTIIGGTTAAAGSFTTLTTASTVTLNGGTVNGVAYLNGSKNLTTGSALTFDGTNLGIGTSSPGYKLDVNTVGGSAATVRLNGNDQANVRLRLENGGSGGRTWEIVGGLPGANNANFSIRDVTGSTTPLTIDSSGNVGIGTSSPADKLEVRFSTNGYITASNSTDTNTGIKLSNTGRSYGIFTDGGSGSSDSLRFYDFTAAAERMRIDSSGNVGIGTSSPTAKLHVSGGRTLAITGNENYSLGIGRESNTNAYYLGVHSTSSPNLLFSNNAGTTNMTLTYDGNLGLGVTPSAWVSTSKGLQVGSVASLSQQHTGATNLMSNAYEYSASAFKYIASAYAGRYNINPNDGVHSWYTAASGTAGNAITFTQAMTLDASGRLGIANTSPSVDLEIGSNTSTTRVVSVRYSSVPLFLSGGFDGTYALSTFSTNAYANATGSGQSWSSISNNGYGVSAIQLASFTAGAEIRFLTAAASNTNPSERARITSAGYFLVGTTTESASSGAGIKIRPGQSAGIAEVSSFSTNANDSLDLYSTGSGSYRFYVGWGGTVFATSTTISAISDQRLKENIRDLDAGLDAVMALKPRKFDWKEGKGQDKKDVRGFIAQEFEQVFPDLIDTWKDPAPEGEEPYKSVRQDLIPVLVKAIQEQQAIIEQLNSRLAALETK